MSNMPDVATNACDLTGKDPAKFLVYSVLEAIPGDPSPEMALNLGGLELGQLRAFRFQDLVALFQKVEAVRLTSLDKKDLAALVADYQQVNIGLFRQWNMVPLRFGTVAEGEADLLSWLAFSYIPLKEALAKVKGRAEFAVHLHWDLPKALADIRQEAGLEATDDLAKAGRLLFEAAERKKREVVGMVHEHLARRAVDSVEMKIIHEDMLMNRSYLVERSGETAFDAAMAEVGKRCKSFFHFKYLGPLPPNSFVPLVFKRGCFDRVDWARRLLQLPEQATLAEVKNAFRKASFASHPDRHPGGGEGAVEFQQISAAFQIIKDYCNSVGESEAGATRNTDQGATRKTALGDSPKQGSDHATGVSFRKSDVEEAYVLRGKL